MPPSIPELNQDLESPHPPQTVMDFFRSTVSSNPILTREEEKELATRMRAGDEEAYEKLYLSNLKLVAFVAMRYRGTSSLAFDDLIQEGNIGLGRGIRRFDPGRGCKVSTYVIWYVVQAIGRAIHDKERCVRFPVNAELLLADVRTLRTHLGLSYDADLSDEILEEWFPGHVDRVRELLKAEFELGHMNSLDKPLEDGEGNVRTSHDLLPSDDPPTDDLTSSKYDLPYLMSVLSEREKRIIELRNFEEMTLEEIGREVGVSRERVRQIESAAMLKMRKKALGPPYRGPRSF